MADNPKQTYANHVRRTPLYYNLAGLTLAVNIVWSGYRLFSTPSIDTALACLVAVAILVAAVAARTQTLTVQNRVIRLEQRLRFRELLPAELAQRASQLPLNHIIALRFASDAELPTLVNEAVSGRLNDPKAIKEKIQDWQGDFLRA